MGNGRRGSNITDDGQELPRRVDRSSPGLLPDNLDLRFPLFLESLRDDDVRFRQEPSCELVESGFPRDLFKHRELVPRDEQDGLRSGLRVAPGVLAGAVYLQSFRAVLDGGDAVAPFPEHGDELHYERGLPGAGPADDRDDGDLWASGGHCFGPVSFPWIVLPASIHIRLPFFKRLSANRPARFDGKKNPGLFPEAGVFVGDVVSLFL